MDLHCHSTASDGQRRPSEVVAEALRQGRTLLALTDHDTMQGLAEARAAAEGTGLRLVPGVEISTTTAVGGKGCHLLAYFAADGVWSPRFEAFLEERRTARERRLLEMADNLGRAGVQLDVPAVVARADGGSVTRAHIAAVLVEQGVVTTLQGAFDRWIGRGRPGWAPYEELTTEQAIALVREEGGVTSVAHPCDSQFSGDELAALRDAGLDGLEVVHPKLTGRTKRRYRGIGRRLGLIATGGSDWHGFGFLSLLDDLHPDRRIEQPVRDAFEEALERARGGRGPR